MQFREAILQVNGKIYELKPNRANTFEEIYVDFQFEPDVSGLLGRYVIFLHPKQDVTIEKLELRFQLPLPAGARFLANGFQSCSETRLMSVTDAIPAQKSFARKRHEWQGDARVAGIPRGKGQLHSWTYTYIKKDAALDHGLFAGSLNEHTGFTLFLYDQASGSFTVRKDLDGLALQHSFPALDVWMADGPEQKVYENWRKISDIEVPDAPAALVWTSGNLLPQQVNAPVLLENIEGFAQWRATAAPQLPAYFIIEDGWQPMPGDWLTAGSAFPNGMGAVATAAKNKGLVPGLWLAPFLAAPQSEILRRNPEWVLKDKNGQPIRAGWNPRWGGWYYALNFYQDGVKEYLSGVFHRMLDQWGFDLLKLDGLYAVSLAPPPGKTRGGVMWEAMMFLRQLMGHKRMVACGVPLGAAFGVADYCRVSTNVSKQWINPFSAFLQHRERPEALASLRSVISRWPLQGRMFQHAPDLFTLLPDRKHLSLAQQQTVLLFHALLGRMLCTSDAVWQYSDLQQAELEEALWALGSRVSEVKELQPDVWRVLFEQEGQSWAAFGNLSLKPVTQGLPGGAALELDPGESIVLKW
ncbi:MAG TPA: glycoside hydrolase family 36 protein [Saprospiraceae bacterium]|nr:glycoside hydrolase family 36 protein [Saprospiraceae bacterium]